MVRSIFFFAQWFIARRRTWLRILTWITRFGYWLFILYGLLEVVPAAADSGTD